MVKIVSEELDPEKVKKVSCGQCATRLEYTLREVQEGKHYDYGGGCDRIYWIVCPSCGHNVSVKGY